MIGAVQRNSFGYQITLAGPKVHPKQWHFGENNTYDALKLIHSTPIFILVEQTLFFAVVCEWNFKCFGPADKLCGGLNKDTIFNRFDSKFD